MNAHPRRTRTVGTRTVWTTGFLAAGLTTGLLVAPSAQSVTGAQASDAEGQFAVKLHIGTGTDRERSCSGTPVDQHWVLTAASCFAADPQQGFKITKGAPVDITVVTLGGDRPTAAQIAKQKVLELVPHPDRDLVMARISDAATIQEPFDGPFPDITPAGAGGVPSAQGDQVRAVGFGRTKDEWVPGRAHTGAFEVNTVNPSTLAISPAGADGAALCKGDAGAPVLRGDKVVGVVTAAWDGGCFNSDETRTGALATRVDDVAGWVQQVRLTSRKAHITDVMTAADFNGDGRTDIAVRLKDDNVEVFHGRPDGTLEFGDRLNGAGRLSGQQLVAGDFDEAKGIEMVGVRDDGTLSLVKRQALWGGPVMLNFWESDRLWTDATWKNGLPAARLRTGSTGRDTVLYQWPDGSLYTYKRDAGGKLVNQKKVMWPDKTWKKKHIATADFNGDGRDDIAAVAADGALHLYPGRADGSFDQPRSMWPDKTWTSERPVLGGDFNGDGKADIVAVRAAGDLRFFAGDGKGGLAASRSMWPAV
ncbi:FG-GAP-like repeat-containing protein [Streptomyces graminilatus]|uniref:FG-GAP-like repeat-containing protein n=1 Tax=Streptomyces graminilatus TaxID=1464070 RepID=UPI0006E31042|nr:FG-GAP-like repeat-containing protein [Streptomyces graminilatus]